MRISQHLKKKLRSCKMVFCSGASNMPFQKREDSLICSISDEEGKTAVVEVF